MDKFILWLRRKRPGTVVRMREYMMCLLRPMGVCPMSATLSARVFRKDGSIEDKGVVGTHAVTDAFVAELVDALQAGGVAAFDDYKYHDSGTDNTAEAAADTVLGAPCGDARTTGTQEEGATGNIYKSVATHTYGGTYSIVEHGLFNDGAVGTLMDRTVLGAAIGVESGDKIEWTYSLTCTAGG
jgi:hypothetical protein